MISSCMLASATACDSYKKSSLARWNIRRRHIDTYGMEECDSMLKSHYFASKHVEWITFPVRRRGHRKKMHTAIHHGECLTHEFIAVPANFGQKSRNLASILIADFEFGISIVLAKNPADIQQLLCERRKSNQNTRHGSERETIQCMRWPCRVYTPLVRLHMAESARRSKRIGATIVRRRNDWLLLSPSVPLPVTLGFHCGALGSYCRCRRTRVWVCGPTRLCSCGMCERVFQCSILDDSLRTRAIVSVCTGQSHHNTAAHVDFSCVLMLRLLTLSDHLLEHLRVVVCKSSF